MYMPLWDIILKLYMTLLKLYFVFYYDLLYFGPMAFIYNNMLNLDLPDDAVLPDVMK